MKTACDYYGCDKPICDEDKKIKKGKRFCQEHSDEFAKLVKGEDVGKLVAFMAKSYGPPEVAAKS